MGRGSCVWTLRCIVIAVCERRSVKASPRLGVVVLWCCGAVAVGGTCIVLESKWLGIERCGW